VPEYRKIKGYPGYLIGDDGSVFSMKLKKPLKLDPEKTGYIRVRLYNKNKYAKFMVHRLVLNAFVGPCPAGMESRHLNGIRSHNRKGNLRWGTKLENAADRIAHGTQHTLRGADNGYAKLSKSKILRIRARRARGEKYQDIANDFGIRISHAYRIANKQSWAHV